MNDKKFAEKDEFQGGQERFNSIKGENKAIVRYAKCELDSIVQEWGKKYPHASYYNEKIRNVERSARDLKNNIGILETGMKYQDGIQTHTVFEEQKFKE